MSDKIASITPRPEPSKAFKAALNAISSNGNISNDETIYLCNTSSLLSTMTLSIAQLAMNLVTDGYTELASEICTIVELSDRVNKKISAAAGVPGKLPEPPKDAA